MEHLLREHNNGDTLQHDAIVIELYLASETKTWKTTLPPNARIQQ